MPDLFPFGDCVACLVLPARDEAGRCRLCEGRPPVADMTPNGLAIHQPAIAFMSAARSVAAAWNNHVTCSGKLAQAKGESKVLNDYPVPDLESSLRAVAITRMVLVEAANNLAIAYIASTTQEA